MKTTAILVKIAERRLNLARWAKLAQAAGAAPWMPGFAEQMSGPKGNPGTKGTSANDAAAAAQAKTKASLAKTTPKGGYSQPAVQNPTPASLPPVVNAPEAAPGK